MKQSRNRIDRRREYRHDAIGADQDSRPVRVTRSDKDQVVLHVHVHNDVSIGDDAQAKGRPRRRTGANTMAARRRPVFSGQLFGWQEHYDPIAKRMAPMVSANGKRPRKLLARLSRLGLLVAALATVVAVGCQYL